jgi:hypothetical protein
MHMQMHETDGAVGRRIHEHRMTSGRPRVERACGRCAGLFLWRLKCCRRMIEQLWTLELFQSAPARIALERRLCRSKMIGR